MKHIRLDLTTPDFTDDAACRDVDPAIFFPDDASHGGPAKAICKQCPVVTACLAYALDYEDSHPGSRWGVYGGTTPRARREIAARNRKAS